jgi:hypothetical protein
VTLSMEDVVMLGGLSCAGEAMGPIDIPATWHADFLARSDTHGPTWTWIQQFSVCDSNSYFQRLYAF